MGKLPKNYQLHIYKELGSKGLFVKEKICYKIYKIYQ